jgi:hypothetical protein
MKRPAANPFGERRRTPVAVRFDVLGAKVSTRSNSRELLALAHEAFGALPPQRLVQRTPALELELQLAEGGPLRGPPPRPRLKSVGGLLLGAMDAGNFALIDPPGRRALVCVDRALLAWPQRIRYELIEFALYTLVPRVLGLVPLHAACVGLAGRGVLLTGEAGAGKSTASLVCGEAGFELLSEDAVFVDTPTMRAVGCANFLHVRTDAFDTLAGPTRALARAAPVIRRHSGVNKFQLDLRCPPFTPPSRPLELVAAIALSRRRARGEHLLEPMSRVQLATHLEREQPYARAQRGWRRFQQRMQAMPSFRLLRGAHPRDAAAAIRRLLEEGRP